MMEICNGKSKRMISLLARESTLALLLGMRPGGWMTAAELAVKSGIEPRYLLRTLNELAQMGVLEADEGAQQCFRLREPVVTLSLDLREIPPGPGYILDVVRFYLVLLTNIGERCKEIGGNSLQDEALDAIALKRSALPDRERVLLSCLRKGIDHRGCISALEHRILAGELGDSDLGWVRRVYLDALQAVMGNVLARLDDSTGKLLLRLSLRDLLRDGGDIVRRFALLEGIPDKYLKQVDG
jgi:DNA-binding HxlR family transcriptional regulator